VETSGNPAAALLYARQINLNASLKSRATSERLGMQFKYANEISNH
jgi:hypothetical protein